MYKILSINGGGIKGYLSCLILAHIEDISGKKISEMFDLVVGSSSGAFLTAVLDTLPASYCGLLLKNTLSKQLFKPNLFNFFSLLNTKYNSNCKYKAIKEILGSKETTRNYDYAILSYDILNRCPVVFNSLQESKSDYIFTKNYNLGEAVCASSAAPIYWDPYKLDDKLLVDAAFLSNDPTSIGVKLALDANNKLEDLVILNIGSGLDTRSYNFKAGKNPIKWLVPTFSMLMTSQSQLSKMLYSNNKLSYYSIDGLLLEASDDIDDISKDNLIALEKESIRIIKENKIQIEELLNKIDETLL